MLYAKLSMSRQDYPQLRQALAILEQVRDDEAMAPGGGDEELEEVINMLSGLIDAVEAMG